MLQKFQSRKFLLTLFSQIGGLLILFAPEYEQAITQYIATGGALLLMTLTSAGWLNAEGKVDQARELTKSRIELDREIDRHLERANHPGGGKSAGPLILLLACLLPMGCVATTHQATPADQWYELRADLNAANRFYTAWANTADLSDPQTAGKAVQWGQKLQKVRALLAEAKPLIDQPGGEFDKKIMLIESILIELASPPTEQDDDANPDTSRDQPDRHGHPWSPRGHRRLSPQARTSPERGAHLSRGAQADRRRVRTHGHRGGRGCPAGHAGAGKA